MSFKSSSASHLLLITAFDASDIFMMIFCLRTRYLVKSAVLGISPQATRAISVFFSLEYNVDFHTTFQEDMLRDDRFRFHRCKIRDELPNMRVSAPALFRCFFFAARQPYIFFDDSPHAYRAQPWRERGRRWLISARLRRRIFCRLGH